MPLRTKERRRVRWTAVLAVLVLAVLGFAGYKFASGVGQASPAAAASLHPSATGPGRPGTANAAQSPSVATSSTSSAATSSASASPTAAPVAAQALAVVRVTAFGPTGTGSGDNPQIAAQATAGNAAAPWYSQWYATPFFGNLKTGTGLLVDMGQTVTVSSVRVWLVAHSGASLQLRAGAKPVPTWLPTVASATNTGGAVQFKLSTPVHVRYLLIWFTKLPPDNAGHYQASVYKIGVQGQR
jgi:hypothetical protein